MSDKRPLEPIMNGRPPLLRSNSKDRHVAHVIPSAAGGCGASFSTPTTSLNTNVLTSSSSQQSQHPRASPRQTPTGGNNSSSSSAAFSASSTAATDANCIPSSAGASPATAPPPLLVVTCPEKRYIRQGRIGKGAFKEVYRAMDEDEGIEVAWSEVDFSQCISKAKVLHEVELLKKMNHPHIIRCFTSWEDPQRQCLIFVTELMTSGTLSDFISQQSRKYLRQNAVVKYGRHILRGLAYLHANDVIHRDLKCSNIFINGNKGEVKIGDLGVSIASRHANSVIGTPEYMAPEMFGEHYTNAIDIWSFGLCLLEMATGRRPYSECDNIGQIYKKLSSGTLPSLEGIHDATLLDVIQSCLAFSPLDRPTAEELLQHAIFYDAAANQPPPQPATSFCSDGYGSSSMENDSLSCAPPSNMRDLSIVDRLNIMDWLRAAPSVIRDEVISFALCRGWIDQKDSDSIALSSTLPPNGRHHQPVNIPFLDPVQVALTSGGGSNARSASISSLGGGGGGGMPTSSAAAAPSLHSTVNAFDPFSSGDSPTMGGGAGGAPTTTPGTQVVGGQHADATAASNGTNQVLSMFPSHSFYDAIEVRSVSGSPVQATATATTTTTTTAPNMSQRPPLPHAIVVPSVSDSSACVPQIAVTPSAATSPNRDRKYGAPPIAATGGSFDTEDEGALSGGATTNGSVATPQHSNKTSGVYLSAASRAASTPAVPTVTTLPTPHHFFDEQQHNNTSGGVPTTTEEEKRRKAAQSEQKLLAQFEMFSAPVVAATTTNNGVHLPSPAQQSLLTVPTSGNGLHHAASAPNLNARASHIHHYLDPIATSGEEPHQAQDMLAK